MISYDFCSFIYPPLFISKTYGHHILSEKYNCPNLSWKKLGILFLSLIYNLIFYHYKKYGYLPFLSLKIWLPPLFITKNMITSPFYHLKFLLPPLFITKNMITSPFYHLKFLLPPLFITKNMVTFPFYHSKYDYLPFFIM